MRILVYIKPVRDVKVSLEYDHRLFDLSESGAVYDMDPQDCSALRMALAIRKAIPSTQITAIHLGPPEDERWVREALSYGCDAGLRIWDETAENLNAPAKALVFSRAAELLGFDLVFTGDCSLDAASNQAGILVAEHFDIPCVSSVTSISLKEDGRTFLLKRIRAKGYEELVEAGAPLAITTRATGNEPLETTFDSLFEAATRQVPCWDFAQMGLPRAVIKEMNSRLNYSHVREISPRLVPAPAPDSGLPAFDRISRLLGATTGKREGKVLIMDKDSTAEEIFKLLVEQRVLDKGAA